MRRSFTIAVMLCAMVAAGVQAQTNQSATGAKTLTELEAQSKAKKKAATPASTSDQAAPSDPNATPTTATTTTGKPAAKKTTTKRTTTVRRTTAKPATATAKKPAEPAAAPAADTPTVAQQGPTSPTVTQATPAAAPPAQTAPMAPLGDPQIYKAGTLPDIYKFKKEKAPEPEKKPATGSSGASTPPSSSSSAIEPATTPTQDASAVAAAPVAAEASTAPAASAHVDAAPAKASTTAPAPTPDAETPTPSAAAPAAQQKSAPAPPPQKTPEKPKPTPTDAPKPAPAKTAAKPSSSTGGWRDRAYISGNAGWQASSTSFSDSRALDTTTGDTEQRHMTASYSVKAGPMFDIGAGIRLVKSLGVAVSVTRFSISNDVAIAGTVPHPFFFSMQRPVSGTAPGTREELAVHVDAVYVIPGKKLQVAIFGGPTFFSAKQTVVSNFSYSDTYPFDNPPTFSGATSTEESKSVTGFNVGADVGYFFNKTFGVGGVIRFARGTFASSIGDLDIGGPQLSAGVRIRIPQGAPSTKAPSPPKPPATKKK